MILCECKKRKEKKKVMLSRYRPGEALGVPRG
jgi:hypothetical protein